MPMTNIQYEARDAFIIALAKDCKNNNYKLSSELYTATDHFLGTLEEEIKHEDIKGLLIRDMKSLQLHIENNNGIRLAPNNSYLPYWIKYLEKLT